MNSLKQVALQRGIGSLVLAILVAIPTAPAADDARALQYIGQGLQRMAEDQRRREQQQERLELERRRTEAAEQQRREAQQRAQQAEQKAAANEQVSILAAEKTRLTDERTPPDDYAGRIVLHRDTLRAPANPQPDRVIVGRYPVAFSPNGELATWVDTQGTLKLWNMRDQTTRDLRPTMSAMVLTLAFAGHDKLMLETRTGSHGAGGTQDWVELMDLDGRSLRKWGPEVRGTARPDGSLVIRQYDGHGKAVSEALIDPPGATLYEVRGEQILTLGYSGETLVKQGGETLYYRNGQLVSRFRGDTRHHPQYPDLTPMTSIIEGSGYAYSGTTTWGDNRFMLWNLTAGTLQCSGSSTESFFLAWDAEHKRLYNPAGAAVLDPASCSLRAIGGPGDRLLIGKDSALLANKVSGRVTLLDPGTLQTMRSIETGMRTTTDDAWGLLAFTDAEDPALLAVTHKIRTQLYDLSTGQLVGAVPAWQRPSKNSDLVHATDYDSNAQTWTTRLWKRAAIFSPALNSFLKTSGKGSYETTEEWRKRASANNLATQMTVELESYDADTGRFKVRYRGMPLTLPIPPETARVFESAKAATLSGELRPLDTSFFELANPKIVLPDGTTKALTAKACPETLESLTSLRAYQHPRLAGLRRQILATSVSDTLEKAKLAGFDRKTALLATRDQGQQYVSDAQRVASTDDAAITADIHRADNDNLPLNYGCASPKKEPVCRYIEQKWRALAADALVDAMRCRGI